MREYVPGHSTPQPSAPKKTPDTETQMVLSKLNDQLALESGDIMQEGKYALRQRLMELEIERDEQGKALSLLQEVRAKEKAETAKQIEATRDKGGEYAEMVRTEMSGRIEKQVAMIEGLLDDKRSLQESLELMADKAQNMADMSEKQKKVLEDRLQVELKKNREAWMASEKVRKERWEKDKVQEIRA